MIVRFLAIPARNRILGCFQLHNHAGETLCERVVNVPRHSVSFFEDRSPLTLLGEFIELKREHDLMGEGLSQFNLLRPIRYTIDMANADKTTRLSGDQDWHGQKSFCASALQILAPL